MGQGQRRLIGSTDRIAGPFFRDFSPATAFQLQDLTT
jgi:hypothetical protein